MPFYTYKAKKTDSSCAKCSGTFEILQQIKDSALEVCPECKNCVVRIIHPAAQVKDSSTSKTLSDDNLKKHGFKKLVNAGGGKFEEAV